MKPPVLVRIHCGVLEAVEFEMVDGEPIGLRYQVPWWTVTVTRSGRIDRSGSAKTLRDAIRYMKHGLDPIDA